MITSLTKTAMVTIARSVPGCRQPSWHRWHGLPTMGWLRTERERGDRGGLSTSSQVPTPLKTACTYTCTCTYTFRVCVCVYNVCVYNVCVCVPIHCVTSWNIQCMYCKTQLSLKMAMSLPQRQQQMIYMYLHTCIYTCTVFHSFVYMCCYVHAILSSKPCNI